VRCPSLPLQPSVVDSRKTLPECVRDRRIKRLDDLSNTMQTHYKFFTDRTMSMDKKTGGDFAKMDERVADLSKVRAPQGAPAVLSPSVSCQRLF
jgi:hypothetical protein